MKILKICVFIFILCILGVVVWFINTRFCIPRYELNDDILIFNESTYIRNSTFLYPETEYVGKIIGIALYGDGILDYIFPIWIREYKDDKEHKQVFVRGLMDVGNLYVKEIE